MLFYRMVQAGKKKWKRYQTHESPRRDEYHQTSDSRGDLGLMCIRAIKGTLLVSLFCTTAKLIVINTITISYDKH